jgi:hypothetical protein
MRSLEISFVWPLSLPYDTQCSCFTALKLSAAARNNAGEGIKLSIATAGYGSFNSRDIFHF